ncbi:CBS domain-containing protein [Aquicella lusitana]|uniref:CBS domain-containing protein n=1 Tax=Aquicella lusitana TaxID=254246 RepID=A0A370GAZ8_9COXI|nr:CBS domain-containing protein [Aquicella lusitana]RDI40965.1 CBS domain-containing protein [Aquicella lusitana]VVC73630.1 Hypoxic response protein 1 [Aquicella lusitana]
MKAKDVMSKKPEFLPPTATLKEAARQMNTHDYGFIPVGENDRLIGAVTDRDIVIRAVAEGKDPAKTTLRDVMSKGIHFCFESDDIEKVAQQMEQLQIRRLVVLNKDKRLTGIISLGDIATKCHNPSLSAELTDAVSQE